MPDPLRTADHGPESAPTRGHTPAEAPTTSPGGRTPSLGAAAESTAGPGGLPGLAGYEITGEIDRGGMGVVYAARDAAFGRRVAVKTLLPKFAGRADMTAQFDREADITARLPHPGVPPVHARGHLADGRPFLVMKLIGGRTLAGELASADRVAARPRLLGVFEQICQTVGFAHSQGIIHRDLKPGNVMVGEFGEVQVMDWGLARVLASRDPQGAGGGDIHPSPGGRGLSDHTVTGNAKGTPAFIPPEQARGEWDAVDARSDVFGLGAILCCVLTGQPPFIGASSADVVWQAATGDVAEARARLDACGADAELIDLCKQCLAPDPDDRPADGKAVAEAVAAYRAGVEERARKAEADRAAAEAEAREQRKRRKVQLALAAAVGLLMAGGGAFAWWRDHKDEEARLKQSQFDSDRKARQAAFDAETAANAENARGRLAELIELAAAARLDYRYPAAEGALRGAGELARKFAPDLAPAVERARADLDFVVALDRIRMRRSTWVARPGGDGDFDDAKAPGEYRAAFAARGLDVAADPDSVGNRVLESAVRADLVTALYDWAILETDDAVRDRVLAALRGADPDSGAGPFRDPAVWNDRAKLAALADRADVTHMPPGAVVAIAAVTWRAGAEAEAARLLRHAVARHPRDFLLVFTLGQVIPRDDPERTGAYRAARALRPDNYAVLTNLGNALRQKGDVDGAVAAHREATRLDRKSARAHYNLGVALVDKGDADGAVAAFREAVRLDPEDAGAHTNLGFALRQKGDVDGAVAAFREAIKLDPKDATAYLNLGAILCDVKRDYGGAVAALKEAVRLDPEFAKAHTNLGIALRQKGDADGAIAAYREAIRRDPKYAKAHYNLGTILCDVKRDYGGAVAALKEAVRLDPKDANAHYNLGIALRQKEDFNGAVAAFRAAIKLNPKDAKAHYNLGAILCNVKRDYDGAVVAFREAIRLDPKDANAHCSLGIALEDKGDADGAIAAYRAAVNLDPKLAKAYYNLGIALGQKEDFNGAVAAYREVIRLKPTYPEAHCNLGHALRDQGKLVEAVAMLRRGHELGSKQPGWKYPSAKWVADCEREMELEGLIAPPPREVTRP